FMGWEGGLLTDSGGFQVFSLSPWRTVSDDGVVFQSPIDGSRHALTPESVMAFQQLLGSDVIVPLDECVRYPSEPADVERALTRTLQWAARSGRALRDSPPAGGCPSPQQFFGIVQGGMDPALRRRAVEGLQPLAVDGYAIGGLSVGEPRALMLETLQATAEALPPDAPHYLMGVGEPLDVVDAVLAGVDLFDCVVPTRHGRNGVAYTWAGRLNLRQAIHARDQRPLDMACGCFACRRHSRSYLHHLVKARELLGLRLLSLHNLWFYADLMRAVREAIPRGTPCALRERLAAVYSDATLTEVA
ncbi:MAG: tRNA guanosine(34) transglycosylase Tgt, partial [Candidatus Omnitrophica bacterium]|nr:tRNA guanosine(34) transglycosylase Tgt [Candidatus Omnitrophota bacterium]